MTFRTDAQGFRNSGDVSQADLVFVGDSFTEAGNVAEEETFVRRTAAALSRTARNLGLFGYAPQEERIVLEAYGLPCEPKVVVWQLCEGNDLQDAVRYAQQRAQWEAAGRSGRLGARVARHTAWSQRSPTYWLFSQFAERARFWLQGAFRNTEGTIQETRFSYVPPRLEPVNGARSKQAHWLYEGLRLTCRTIAEAKSQLEDRGIRLVVLFLPTKMTTMGDLVVFDAWSTKRLPAGWQVPAGESFGALLGRCCRELDISYVDATRALREASQAGELTFLPFDTHLSPRGHEIVSAELVKQLEPLLRESDSAPR